MTQEKGSRGGKGARGLGMGAVKRHRSKDAEQGRYRELYAARSQPSPVRATSRDER